MQQVMGTGGAEPSMVTNWASTAAKRCAWSPMPINFPERPTTQILGLQVPKTIRVLVLGTKQPITRVIGNSICFSAGDSPTKAEIHLEVRNTNKTLFGLP